MSFLFDIDKMSIGDQQELEWGGEDKTSPSLLEPVRNLELRLFVLNWPKPKSDLKEVTGRSEED